MCTKASAKKPAEPPILLNELLFISDLLKAVTQKLDQGITVCRYVYSGPDGVPILEFETRVTRIGKTPVPRTTGSSRVAKRA